MKLNSSEIRLTSRANRTWSATHRGADVVRISEGCHVPQARFAEVSRPWDARNLVAEARVLAATLGARRRGEIAFTGESALVVLSLQPWWNNPDVQFRRDGSNRSPASMPSVTIGDFTVPKVRVRELRSTPSSFRVSRAFGVDVVEPHLVAADLARYAHPLQAFHNVSILLRHLARFDRFDIEGSRSREKFWRSQLLSYFDDLGKTKGGRRARVAIASANAALESPAESIVSWVLNCILEDPSGLRAQHPWFANGRRIYMDLAIPACHLCIEVTGYGKFGDSEISGREVGSRLIARQQALAETGWRVINITYEGAQDVVELSLRLRELLAQSGVATHPPKGLLWEPPSPELFSADRRF